MNSTTKRMLKEQLEAETSEDVETLGIALIIITALRKMAAHCQSEILTPPDDNVSIELMINGLTDYNVTITIERS